MALLFSIYWISEKMVYSKKLLLINIMVLLSLLSKESGIVCIPILLGFIFLFSKNKLKPMAFSLFSTFCFYLFLRLGVARLDFTSHATAPPIANATLIQRLLTIPYEIFSYIRLIFFPKDLFISQQFVIKTFTDPRFYVFFPIALLTIAVLITFAFKFKSKLYVFFLLWTIFSFSLILNIYPLDFSLAERWLYGPLIGILGIFGVLLIKIFTKFKYIGYILVSVLILALPILIARTVIRNRDWKNNITLVSHDLKLNPDSYELQGDYGTLLGLAGDMKGAKAHIEKALALSPTWWVMYSNLGTIYENENNFEKAKELYLLAIRNSNDIIAYENLAVIKYKTENPRSSVDFVINSLKYYPSDPTLNFIAALSYYKLNDKISALTYIQKVYYLYPSTQTYTAVQRISNNQNIDDLLK
jgi:tetratricopeptide (TPR) repeat protein